jgi:phage-related protein
MKKTQKTLLREIERAKRELEDFRKRDELGKKAQAKERTSGND